MAKQDKSKVLGIAHRFAEDVASAGMLERETLKQFDGPCRTPLKRGSARKLLSLLEKNGLDFVA